MIKEIPPACWHFFQVTSFFMLQCVRNPITEFIRSLGMIFPVTIINTPMMPKTSWTISNETDDKFSILPFQAENTPLKGLWLETAKSHICFPNGQPDCQIHNVQEFFREDMATQSKQSRKEDTLKYNIRFSLLSFMGKRIYNKATTVEIDRRGHHDRECSECQEKMT